MEIDKSKIVKSGEWFYDGIISCSVIIQNESFLPGSGDYEDPEDIGNDRSVTSFSVWFENPAQKGEYNAGGGHFLTVEEAMKSAEDKISGQVRWNK